MTKRSIPEMRSARKPARALAMGLALVIAGASALHGETVSLEGGRLVFVVPDDFKPLSEEIKNIKFGLSPTGGPEFVIGNESTGTTIAFAKKPHALSQDKLEELRQAFTLQLPKVIPGLVWKENKIMKLSGQKWILLEMTTAGVDTDIHNIMLVTDFDGRMLVLNFNSTKEEFKQYESVLRASIASIQIKREAQPPATPQAEAPPPESSPRIQPDVPGDKK